MNISDSYKNLLHDLDTLSSLQENDKLKILINPDHSQGNFVRSPNHLLPVWQKSERLISYYTGYYKTDSQDILDKIKQLTMNALNLAETSTQNLSINEKIQVYEDLQEKIQRAEEGFKKLNNTYRLGNRKNIENSFIETKDYIDLLKGKVAAVITDLKFNSTNNQRVKEILSPPEEKIPTDPLVLSMINENIVLIAPSQESKDLSVEDSSLESVSKPIAEEDLIAIQEAFEELLNMSPDIFKELTPQEKLLDKLKNLQTHLKVEKWEKQAQQRINFLIQNPDFLLNLEKFLSQFSSKNKDDQQDILYFSKKDTRLPFSASMNLKTNEVFIYLKKFLGRGSYKTVFFGLKKQGYQLIPIAYSVSPVEADPKAFQFSEIALMKQFNHEKILKVFHDIICDSGKECKNSNYIPHKKQIVVTEFCTSDLEELIKSYHKERVISEEKIIEFSILIYQLIKDLLEGLVEIEKKNIYHQDIKPKNILIHQDLHNKTSIKIADFGFAQEVNAKREKLAANDRMLTGTPLYLPPEKILKTKYHPPHLTTEEMIEQAANTRGDIWAAGVLLFHLRTGHELINILNPSVINKDQLLSFLKQLFHSSQISLENIRHPEVKQKLQQTALFNKLNQALLTINVNQRPSAEECLNILHQTLGSESDLKNLLLNEQKTRKLIHGKLLNIEDHIKKLNNQITCFLNDSKIKSITLENIFELRFNSYIVKSHNTITSHTNKQLLNFYLEKYLQKDDINNTTDQLLKLSKIDKVENKLERLSKNQTIYEKLKNKNDAINKFNENFNRLIENLWIGDQQLYSRDSEIILLLKIILKNFQNIKNINILEDAISSLNNNPKQKEKIINFYLDQNLYTVKTKTIEKMTDSMKDYTSIVNLAKAMSVDLNQIHQVINTKALLQKYTKNEKEFSCKQFLSELIDEKMKIKDVILKETKNTITTIKELLTKRNLAQIANQEINLIENYDSNYQKINEGLPLLEKEFEESLDTMPIADLHESVVKIQEFLKIVESL